jgi:hypothetical protein
MKLLLKLTFDQNLIIINHKSNGDFKRHIIFRGTQETKLPKAFTFFFFLSIDNKFSQAQRIRNLYFENFHCVQKTSFELKSKRNQA